MLSPVAHDGDLFARRTKRARGMPVNHSAVKSCGLRKLFRTGGFGWHGNSRCRDSNASIAKLTVGKNNRVGGGVAPAVRPHHRTYSSYPAVSVTVVIPSICGRVRAGRVSGTRRCSCLAGRRVSSTSATSLCRKRLSSSSDPEELPVFAGKQQYCRLASAVSTARTAVCGESTCPDRREGHELSHGGST